MQSIERYGVVALLFLIVTVAAVLLWGDGSPPEQPREAVASTGVPRPSAGNQARASLASSRRAPSAVTDARERPLQAEAEAATPADRFGTPAEPTGGLGLGPSGIVPGGTGDQRAADPASAHGEDDASRQLAGAEDARLQRIAEAAERAERQAAEHEARAKPSGVPVYEVRSGEVLGVIAQRELGSVRRMGEIIDLNPGLNPDKIRAGLTLRMPTDWSGAGSSVAMLPPEPAAAPEQAAVTAPPGMRVYVVREGESLWNIAARQLGSGGRYREIEKANPGIEGGRIVPGQEIFLPGTEVALAPPRRETPARSRDESGSAGRKVR